MVLGTIETLFHLPIFFNNGRSAAGGQNGMPMLAFAVGVFGLVFVFTWLYQNTHGSLLIATAFHASANTWTTVFQVPSSSPAFSWLMAAAALLVSAIVLAAGSARSAPRRPLEPLSSSKAVARP